MNKIEEYLENADKKQRYLIYLMLFGLIFYLFFNVVSPMRETDKSLKNSVDVLQTKLVNNSLKRLKRQRNKKKKEFLELKSKLELKKEHINHLISELYKLKYAFYDDKEWAKSLDDILHYSVVRNLEIEYIKSSDIKENKNSNMLKKRKKLEIYGSGRYVDIVAFISYMDNLNTLLKFQNIQIALDNQKLKFKLLIYMYGIGL